MSNDEQGYNGWTNYETWVVALWINNDRGWQESVREAVRGIDVAHPGGPVMPVEIERALGHAAGRAVQQNVEDVVWYPLDTGDGIEASLAADLLSWALARVNWTEIGAAFLSDLAEQDA